MWSKAFYLFSFAVLQIFSLHEVWDVTLDTLFTFFFNLYHYFSQCPYFACLFSSVSSGASVFLCILAVYRVFMFLCIFFLFVLFFEVYTHSYTSWSCIQPSIHVLLVKRQRKSPLPRISTFWPREMCPEELYADGRQLVCLFCC